ncbi:NAD-dependent succinate-semialdehyde dehydrogenase [Aquimarina muelleri]|uniref:Succinate-semialdehyde dehydrogenase n=1 Tax=Aquimarina muelleri TaxID=279356 RepID=A0A918JZ97_9FLAO|nr:NAD-dependent succinate-semialdehyde dehydrogenase [Aquimarina muelleri]MCX2764744.1 NAD-dependent succinate-semialdehyde dehydrogenase [Aquimarina muelleri]GGX33512.1 succinate-semialdehyde dehydrogenase [Aquimarina muelleri]
MSKNITTIYPFTGNVLKEYNFLSKQEVNSKLEIAQQIFLNWRKEPLNKRTKLLNRLSILLDENKEKYATLITQEMGKPYHESISEIEKCIWLIDFYEKNAEQFLADALIDTEANESFISYDPLGCILGIMPWNYPFWQALRFAIPTITAGNVILLKHANNVSGCALVLQDLFEDSGYPKGSFQTLLVNHDQIEEIIKNDIIKAVSLTGSEGAGRTIAKITGQYLKKTVLELGGNNACIIWEDAELDKHINTIVKARMQNTGQSCIAAKRFIVVESIYEEFLEKFKIKIESLKIGDPMDKETDISTLARIDLAKEVERQIEESVKKGAKIITGNNRKETFFSPTIVTEVKPGMPVFDEEVFGPVASVIKAKDRSHSLELASQSSFGLGTMLFTQSIEDARKQIDNIEDGAFFINEMVKSDPRLPFGGTKASGYGRELSKEGILEFVNKKTVYITK